MISLHSHSGQFCRHAKGQLEDVVQEAIKQGFKVYGLSEHIPRYRLEDLYPEEVEESLSIQDLEETFHSYIEEATRLKQKYADDIELLIGLETEYIIPDSLSHLSSLLFRYKQSVDYSVGSVHHVNGVPIDFDKATFDKALATFPKSSNGGLSQLNQLFESYFDAQYELMQAYQPEVIGHFDLCRLYLPDATLNTPSVWSRVERNVEYAVSYGALFEVNAAAFRKGWKAAYPAPDVLRLIQSKGGRFTLSDDSHGPHAVGLHYKDAHLYLVEQRIHDLWYLTTSEEVSGGTETAFCENLDNDGQSPSRDAPGDPKRENLITRRRTRAVKLPEGWQEDAFWLNRNA